MGGAILNANQNVISIEDNAVIGQDILGGAAIVSALTAGAVSINSQPGLAESKIEADSLKLNANSNIITIGEHAIVTQNIYGGYISVNLMSGDASSTFASNSSLFPNASISTPNNQLFGSNNVVNVGNHTEVVQSIYGAMVSLSVTAGSATNLDKAQASINANNIKINANENKVNFGGILREGDIYGSKVEFNLTPGKVNGTISTIDTAQSSVIATDNEVGVGENAQFIGTNSSLYGGYLVYKPGYAPSSYDVFTSNTLNYAARTPAFFNTVGNFQNYNFTLTPELAGTNTALITAQNIILGTDANNISDGSNTMSDISVVGIHSGKVLQADDKFILMQSINDFSGSGATEQTTTVQQGISLLYDVQTKVDTTTNQVTATILGCNTTTGGECPSIPQGETGSGGTGSGGTAARVNPQLKALSEGYLASTQLLLRGADLLAFDAIVAINEQNHSSGWKPFVVTSGQYTRYNSGSHIKSNDYLMTGGISYQQDNIIFAGIIEGGWGNYDSYNSFSNATNVKGNGHGNYYGVGLLGRYDFDDGLYADASIRYGTNRTKFKTNDIVNLANGEKANYDINTNYASAHIGIGYLLPLNTNNHLDISTKYLWSTTKGKNIVIAGDNFHFQHVDSNRVRLDAQIDHKYSDTFTLRGGLAYEYEFSSKVKATTYGNYHIEAPDVKGGTGIITIGTFIKPTPQSHFAFNIKAQGYTGKRQGVGLNFRGSYSF